MNGVKAALGLVGLLWASLAWSAELTPAQRGEQKLLGRSYAPGVVPVASYRNAWKLWGVKGPPADLDAALAERYGLHPAPYPNDGLPMGLRQTTGLLGGKVLATDCLLCHGGSIAGKSYVGLGNTALEIQAFFEEVFSPDGRPAKTPFRFGTMRGTSEAGGMAVFLLGYRDPDLRLRPTRLELGLYDDLCEDVPAWWLLKKKKTMYHTGGSDARSVRSLMQFMLSPLNPPTAFEHAEDDFRDIQAYLLSLQPPRYPEPTDAALAKQGEALFRQNCARCHGTYGADGAYPNKVVPLDEIGTDRHRFDGITEKFGVYYDQSWFAREKGDEGYKSRATKGYQAPPLDGVWATAPYLHNASVPTLYGVLNSKARPKAFTRSYRTDKDAYDWKHVGWKVQVLQPGAGAGLPPLEQRRIYDTTLSGRGNGGHTFGDDLTEPERWAVIEYLKTL